MLGGKRRRAREAGMQQRFASGDRVIVTDEHVAGVPRGTRGTVVRVFARVPEICDVLFDGHTRAQAVLTSALEIAPAARKPDDA